MYVTLLPSNFSTYNFLKILYLLIHTKKDWPVYFFPPPWKNQDVCNQSRTTDTQWRHKSKKSENLGQCGRKNMLRTYLKIWEWELIFGRAVKAISSPGVRSLCNQWWMRYSPLLYSEERNLSHSALTLIGMRKGTFHPLSFLDQNLSAEFLSKNSKLFLDMKIYINRVILTLCQAHWVL